MSHIDKMICRWNEAGLPVEERLTEALFRLEKMHNERLKLDRRIHNQRASCRMTWEIVEMRRKWLGSETTRKAWHRLWKSYRELRASQVTNGDQQ